MEEVEEFYRAKYKHLLRQLVARRIDPYDAEDIIQEAFSRALRYYDSFNPAYCTFGQWFGGILNRCSKDFHRDERLCGMNDEVKEDTLYTEDDFGANNKLVEEIKKEIGKLEGLQQQICFLYFIRQQKPRHIVEILDCKNKTVRDYVLRFKHLMRKKYSMEE